MRKRFNRAKEVVGFGNNDEKEKEKPSGEGKPERDLKNKHKGSSSKGINTTKKSENTPERDRKNKTKGSSRDQEKRIERPGAVSDPNQVDFKNVLQQIHQAAEQGFENLKCKCASTEFSSLYLDERVDFCSMEVDETSKRLLPASRATRYVPLKTTGDENCFFRAASILAFGHERQHEEMRVRIVVELAVEREFYLADLKGIGRRPEAEILEIHPNSGRLTSNLNFDDVKTEFESEVLDSARDSAWASYWHLQALGTVLNRLVRSVYPEYGGSEIRKYFDAVITPRLYDKDKEPLTIMWTHTSGYNGTKFVPNHFVPLISADKMTPFRIKVSEPNNEGPVPSEDEYKSIEPLQSDKKPDLIPDVDERGNNQRDEKDNVKSGPYCQETENNSSVYSGRSLKRVEPGSFLAETIAHDIFVMDELALQLDRPASDIPTSRQYWLHLAQCLEVPEDKRSLFQQNSDYRPSETMFAYLFAREPESTIRRLKDYFSKIVRPDLVKLLDQSSLEGSDTWGKLRDQEWETFHRICFKLDCSSFDNWNDFGRALGIPDNVLGKCARSGDYAETIFLIIRAKKPTLQIKEMKDALKDMERCDVCEELSKLQENSTIQTLMEDPDVLRKVCDLLDDDKLSANWKVFAQKFGVSKKECNYLCPATVHSPTRMLMEYLSQAKPNLTLESFLKAVLAIGRHDVVVALKRFFNNNDIDIIVDTIQQSGAEQRDEQAGKH